MKKHTMPKLKRLGRTLLSQGPGKKCTKNLMDGPECWLYNIALERRRKNAPNFERLSQFASQRNSNQLFRLPRGFFFFISPVVYFSSSVSQSPLRLLSLSPSLSLQLFLFSLRFFSPLGEIISLPVPSTYIILIHERKFFSSLLFWSKTAAAAAGEERRWKKQRASEQPGWLQKTPYKRRENQPGEEGEEKKRPSNKSWQTFFVFFPHFPEKLESANVSPLFFLSLFSISQCEREARKTFCAKKRASFFLSFFLSSLCDTMLKNFKNVLSLAKMAML